MKILLINPSLFQATTGQYEEKLEKERGLYPPLGLAYIAAVLLKNNHDVRIIDCDAEADYQQAIQSALSSWQPDLVGMYAMTWSFQLATKIAKDIKAIKPEIKIILGGPNITTMPEASMRSEFFDYGVMGEGEETIIELVDKLTGKNDIEFENLLGLVFRKNGVTVINQMRPLIADLDSIPFPARQLLPMGKYSDVFTRKKKFATIIATRGCPFDCTFCDRKNRMGKRWRFRSVENIIQEIKGIINNYGIREFMFFDDNLIVDKKWAYDLCAELKKLQIIWECRERVDMIDESILHAMKDAGCYRIRFGFESGNNEILKIIHKGITVEQTVKCAEICHKVGIEMFGYFMMGSPGETTQTIQQTLDLALKINPSFVLFSKTILIPGSELFRWGVEQGQIKADYWERFIIGEETNGAPTISTKELPEKIVDEFVKQANKKFYFRPTYMINKLLAIRSFYQLWRQLKMAKNLLPK